MVPKVSIAIPVINEMEHLRTLLPQLKRQGYPNLEVIVVDGGSADGSAEYARSQGAKVVREPVRKGLTNARNIGLKSATGEIFATIDADWEVSPGAIGAAMARLRDPKVLAVALGAKIADETFLEKVTIAELKWFLMRLNLMRTVLSMLAGAPREESSVHLTTYFWRRKALMEMGGWDTSLFYGEDTDVRVRTARYAKKHGASVAYEPGPYVTAHQPHSLWELYIQQRRYGKTILYYILQKPFTRATALFRLLIPLCILGPLYFLLGLPFREPVLFISSPLIAIELLKVTYVLLIKLDPLALLIPFYDSFKAVAFLDGLVRRLLSPQKKEKVL